MKNNLYIFLILGWSVIFPSLSFNSFTTDLTDENIKYTDLYNAEARKEILQSADYDFWLKTIFLSSNK